jgi:hypothetical protein
MVPSTVVKPRDGSFALASFGRVRNVQESAFSVAAGRKSFALKRILEFFLVILAWNAESATLEQSTTRKSSRFHLDLEDSLGLADILGYLSA